MSYLTRVEELDKIIRKYLISQSSLNPIFVRNALSIYGANLDNGVNRDISEALQRDENIIIFELLSESTGDNVSQTIDNDVVYSKAYRIHITIYGNNARNLSNALVARFRTEKVRNDIHDEGVHIVSISDSTDLNEFVNNAIWIRSDFDISVACEFLIEQIENENEFSALSSLESEVI